VKDDANKTAEAQKRDNEAHASHIRENVSNTVENIKKGVNDKIDEHKHKVEERRPA
jgi:hypothetical protein